MFVKDRQGILRSHQWEVIETRYHYHVMISISQDNLNGQQIGTPNLKLYDLYTIYGSVVAQFDDVSKNLNLLELSSNFLHNITQQRPKAPKSVSAGPVGLCGPLRESIFSQKE